MANNPLGESQAIYGRSHSITARSNLRQYTVNTMQSVPSPGGIWWV